MEGKTEKPHEPDFTIMDLYEEIRKEREGEQYIPPRPDELDPQGIYTTRELSVLLGVSRETVRNILHKYWEEKRLEQTLKVVPTLGRKGYMEIDAYRLLSSPLSGHGVVKTTPKEFKGR